jgi:hypothetical protein
MARAGTCIGRVALVMFVTVALHAPRETALVASSVAPGRELALQLTSTQALPPRSVSALMTEATSIWKESRVALHWLSTGAETRPDVLRVLVKAGLVPSGELSPWTVGELVRMEDSRALAIASITGARRIVEQSRFKVDDPPAVSERRLGVVLGRAIAHEIGHYLLQTNTHAAQGLMRARIDAREFADLRNGSFRLDAASQSHLERLTTRGAISLDPPSVLLSVPQD